MKISKSKQELARIISENGGWCDGANFSAQDKDGEVFHYSEKPTLRSGRTVWDHRSCIGYGEFSCNKLPNWHQTILSRAEYFHLYQAPDADGWIECATGEPPAIGNKVVDVRFRDGETGFGHSNGWNWSIYGSKDDIIAYRLHKPEQAKSTAVGDDETNLAAREELEAMDYKPSIEQMAADYRNAKDCAERKQKEADAAKADADAKLKALELAGEALGLIVTPTTAKQESELAITDWRDLQENDWIWYGGDIETPEGEYRVIEIEVPDYMGYTVKVDKVGPDNWIDTGEEWRFIRRP